MAVKRDSDGPSTPVKASQAPKDLITLMNARNGETYKFACKTCIDGHRAPLCDPKKHRGKIMFRRPAPGRPARQCGHPKAAKCDCLAKRTLCCVLSSEQWDSVEAGNTVKVAMYDSREDLDAAQAASSAQSLSTPSAFSDKSSTPLTGESFSSASTPSQVPRLQMFGVGGPQGDSKPGPDPFAWTGEVPQVSLHDIAPQYQPMPPPNYMPQPAAPYQYFTNDFPSQTSGITPTEVHRNSIAHHPVTQASWPQPRPEYMSFDQPSFSPMQDPHFGALKLEHMQLSPDLQSMQTSQMFSAPNHGSQFAPASQHHLFGSLPVSDIPDFGIDTDMMMGMNFDPSQPPDNMQDVTQSCCSSKRTQPQPSTAFQAWQFPPSAPTQQFPCARCASTMCTCTNCPDVMQNPHKNGAWARACGRDGHLDAEEFISNIPEQHHVPQQQTMFPPQQQQQQNSAPTPSAPTPAPARSCCGGGGGGSSSGAATAQSSPFPQPVQDAPPWLQPQQTELPHRSISYDANSIAVDPAMLYQSPEWQNMH